MFLAWLGLVVGFWLGFGLGQTHEEGPIFVFGGIMSIGTLVTLAYIVINGLIAIL